MKKILSYIPKKAYSKVNNWLEKYNCEVTISYPENQNLEITKVLTIIINIQLA